jgi:hypothetical protein
LIGTTTFQGFGKEYNICDKAVTVISSIDNRVVYQSQSDRKQTQESVSPFEHTNELNGSNGRDAETKLTKYSD